MKKLMLFAGLLLGAMSSSASAPALTQAPEFAGIDHWFNSPPLSMSDLRGKVVLIDFWAYSCINCVRAMPHVEHLYETYKDKGLVVIGVHSPEFDFEHDPANVQAAIGQIGVTYPVAMDSRLATWHAWHNQYWPAEYLVDQDGRLIGHHYGEDGYDKMENAIRLLLGLNMLPAGNAADVFKPGPGDTPELHLGSSGQEGFGSVESGSDGTRRFSVPAQLAVHKFALAGQWEITRQYARAVSAQVELQLRFKAAKLYMVASADRAIPLDVTVDGNPQPPVIVQGSRLYTLFDSHDDREHLLRLRVSQADLRVYSFTFG
ncbi:thioredoxin family protein [Dyella sp. OK004]|uniref:thioredoxin family protein n=1 Tax=Dyella sp. OK004 TaxID=1855292 RepID=UPI000AEF57FE|nr:thioredoxin family protein [Dyella sp. OK004]